MAALKVQGLLLPHCLLPQALHLPPGFLAPHSRGTSPSLSISLSLSLSLCSLSPFTPLSWAALRSSGFLPFITKSYVWLSSLYLDWPVSVNEKHGQEPADSLTC